MKRAKAETPVYAFYRYGDCLWPDMDMDRRALDGINPGQRVRVEIKRWRNSSRNRAYWAMLGEVIEATECALSPERLHQVLKLENGCVELVQLPSGYKVAIPGSISFDEMSEPEFMEFFRRAERWLAETYGWVPKERT